MTGMMHPGGSGDSTMQPDYHDLDPPLPEVSSHEEPDSATEPDAWRQEVAARLARYRTRRKPRAPRYPSLLLPFDSANTWSRNSTAKSFVPAAQEMHEEIRDRNNEVLIPPGRVHSGSADEAQHSLPSLAGEDQLQFQAVEESFTNVIEFPRSAAIPVFHDTELAEPIVSRPRIVEAPEIVPPPPALGGILIESPQPELPERHLSTAPSVASASIARRLMAASLDALVLAAALSAGGAIFLRLNPIRLPVSGAIPAAGGLLVILWMIYQFVFIVATGSTPGLRVSRLQIAKLDGSSVSRRTRRWRVLASFLSGFAAGLGYLWCFLDQDSLSWHDRISRTHIQPVVVAGKS
jgi:uncharacterized RDD family membrane protein YckC